GAAPNLPAVRGATSADHARLEGVDQPIAERDEPAPFPTPAGGNASSGCTEANSPIARSGNDVAQRLRAALAPVQISGTVGPLWEESSPARLSSVAPRVWGCFGARKNDTQRQPGKQRHGGPRLQCTHPVPRNAANVHCGTSADRFNAWAGTARQACPAKARTRDPSLAPNA